jgi:DNA replication protein DnaC
MATIMFYQKKLRLSPNLTSIVELIPFNDKEQFILELLTSLYEERRQNIITRQMKVANFPVVKTLDDYSFAGIRLPDKVSIEDLKNLTFIDNKENLILYGGVGSGKTHLGIALGIMAVKEEHVVLFFTVHELVNHLVNAKEQASYDKFMKKLTKAHLIVLDEWGYLPLHQEGARLLFEVISLCYEQRSIIITTNIEFSHWKNFLFDEKLTAAIIDRIVHHSHLLFYDRSSYRREHALMK